MLSPIRNPHTTNTGVFKHLPPDERDGIEMLSFPGICRVKTPRINKSFKSASFPSETG